MTNSATNSTNSTNSTFAVGQVVYCLASHPKAVGTILAIRPAGLVVEFVTPKEMLPPFGHIIRELWTVEDATRDFSVEAPAIESPAYNAAAVQKEIAKDKRIGKKEAKAIHALLKGRA